MATLYVGSEQTYKTIAEAVAAAAAGDTVIIKGSEYTATDERVTVNKSLTLKAEGDVTMRGLNIGGADFDLVVDGINFVAAEADASGATGYADNASCISQTGMLRNVTIENCTFDLTNAGMTRTYGIFLSLGTWGFENLVVRNNVCEGYYDEDGYAGYGLIYAANVNNADVSNNTITYAASHAIQLSLTGKTYQGSGEQTVKIDGNIVDKSYACAVYCADLHNSDMTVEINDNVVSNVQEGSCSIYHGAIRIGQSTISGVEITGNVIDGAQVGIYNAAAIKEGSDGSIVIENNAMSVSQIHPAEDGVTPVVSGLGGTAIPEGTADNNVIVEDAEIPVDSSTDTVYVNNNWSAFPEGTAVVANGKVVVIGTNAFADVNSAAAKAETTAGKLVIVKGADVTYDANQWFLLNTPAKEIETDKWSYDYVVDASETYDLQIDGTIGAYQVLLNNAETVVSSTGKLYANSETLRIMGGTFTVDGVREAGAAAPEEIFTGSWGAGTKPGADTQIKAGYIQINQGAVADFNNTVVFVNAGWMNFDNATAEFNNSYIYLGSGGSYAPIAVQIANGAEVTFADNTTIINDTEFTMNITVDATSTLTLDATSSITATTLTVADGGKFIIDASNFSGYKKVVDLSGASLEGKVTIIGDGISAIYGADGDVTITDQTTDTVYVNSAWAGSNVGATVGAGYIYGFNAAASLSEAAGMIKTDGSDTTIKFESDVESGTIEFKYGTGDIIFTADSAVTVKQTALGSDWAFTDAQDITITIDENVTFEIYDNASGWYQYYGPSLELYGTITGGQNWGCAYLFNGEHNIYSTGTMSVGRVQLGFSELNVIGDADSDRTAAHIDTNYLLVEASTFTASNAIIDAAAVHDTNNGGPRWGASEFYFNDSSLTASTVTLKYADSVFKVTGNSSLNIGTLTGSILFEDADLTASSINKGTVNFKGENSFAGDFNAAFAYVGDWNNEEYDGSVDFGTESNVNVGGQMIIGYDTLVPGANNVVFGDVTGEVMTDKVFKAADVSVRRDGTLTIANTTGENKINTMNVMGSVVIDNAKVSGEFQIGGTSNGEVTLKNGAEYTLGGSSNSVVVLGKSTKGTLNVDNATVTVKRCGAGGGYNVPADTFVIGYNGGVGVLNVSNNGKFVASDYNGDKDGGKMNVQIDTGSEINVTSNGTVDVAGAINNAGSITLTNGNLTAEEMNLGSFFKLDGLTAGDARTITVAFMPAGETEDGFTKQIEVAANATKVNVWFTDIADGEYTLTIIDGAKVFTGTTTIVNGTLNINGGSLTLDELSLNKGAASITGDVTVNIGTLNGSYLRFEDSKIVGDSNVGGNIRAFGDFEVSADLTVKQSNLYGTTVVKSGSTYTGSTTIVGGGAKFTLEEGAELKSRFFNVVGGTADIEGDILLDHSDPRQKLLQIHADGVANLNEGSTVTITRHNAIVNAGGTLNVNGGSLIITPDTVNVAADRGGVIYNSGVVNVNAGSVDIKNLNNAADAVVSIAGGSVSISDTLTNEGKVEVVGASTLKVGTLVGVIEMNNAELSASSIAGGKVVTFGDNAFSGTNNIDTLHVGYFTNPDIAAATSVTITGNYTGAAVVVGSYGTMNIGAADADRTSMYVSGVGNWIDGSTVSVTNADVEFNNALSMTGDIALDNAKVKVTWEGQMNTGNGTGKVVLTNGSTLEYTSIFYVGGYYETGDAVLSVTDSTVKAATLKTSDNAVITLDNGDLIATNELSLKGSIAMDLDSTITFGNITDNGGSFTIDMTDLNNAVGNKLFDYTGSNAAAWDLDAYKALIGNWDNAMEKFFTVEDGDLVVKSNAVATVTGGTTDEANHEYSALQEAVDKNYERIVVEDAAVNAPTALKGTETIVTGGTFKGTISGGEITASSDYKTDWQDSEGDYSLSISGGTFNKIVMGANRVDAGLSEHVGNVELNISGGTFNQIVAGGMVYADTTVNAHRGQAILTGDINMTISGGTFSKYIYGGNISGKAEYAGCTMVDGNINITIDAVNAINFQSGCTLVAGSYRNGSVFGDITVTVKGDGANLNMHDDFQIWGGSSSDVYLDDADRTFQSTVSGDRTFVFDEFSGDFDARIRGFAGMEIVGGSNVNVTKGNLADISDWLFEAGSTLTGDFGNDFAGDDLAIDLGDWSGSSCEIMSGDADLFTGIEDLASVTVGGAELAFDGVSKWASSSYELELKDGEDGKKVLALVNKLA